MKERYKFIGRSDNQYVFRCDNPDQDRMESLGFGRQIESVYEYRDIDFFWSSVD